MTIAGRRMAGKTGPVALPEPAAAGRGPTEDARTVRAFSFGRSDRVDHPRTGGASVNGVRNEANRAAG
jgi:hypothetical protein